MFRCLFACAALLISVCVCAEVVRSQAVLRQFRHDTGYPNGRPGYVIDHVIPLCACQHDPDCLTVLDAADNLQWQDKATAATKDRREKAVCASIRRAIKRGPVPDQQQPDKES